MNVFFVLFWFFVFYLLTTTPARARAPPTHTHTSQVMQPMTIAGALIGSFLNKILPELPLVICLVLLLAVNPNDQTIPKLKSTIKP